MWVLGTEEPTLLTTKSFLQPPDMGPWVRGAKEVMSFQFFIIYFFYVSKCLPTGVYVYHIHAWSEIL